MVSGVGSFPYNNRHTLSVRTSRQEREADDESAALARPITVCMKGSTMQVNESFGEREADAEPAAGSLQ